MPTLTEQINELALLMEADPKEDERYRQEALTFLENLRRKLGDQAVIDDLLEMPHKKTQGLAGPHSSSLNASANRGPRHPKILSFAISTYSGSSSIPMNFRSRSMHATPVVPEPQ